MLRTRRRKRRGLALMMVLSLLVLFLLMGVSFLMVASTSEKGARAQAKTELRGDDPRKLAEMVMYQLLRDTSHRSSISGHSLLADLYGNDGATGTLVYAEPVAGPTYQQTGGQFMLLQSTNIFRPGLLELTGQPASVPTFPGYFNGRVITMVNGAAKGLSTRIVDSRTVVVTVNGNPQTRYQLRVESFESDSGPVVPFGGDPTIPLPGDRFLINGAPFNGSGAGYNAANWPVVDDRDGNGLEIAISPHYIFPNVTRARANLGGADESYDAVDYQNMFLAMVPANSTGSSEIVPSFHRPSLINYWYDQWIIANDPNNPPPPGFRPYLQGMSAVDFGRLIARKFSLRPLPFLHPKFSGSNSQLTFSSSFYPNNNPNNPPNPGDLKRLLDWLRQDESAAGLNFPIQWDVDNDNDGVPDSIWLDVGLPVTTSPDGRRVKPLVAILVKDLDGRLNLNAHSSLAQSSGSFIDIANNTLQPSTAAYAGGGGPTSTQTLARGRGYGPAEIYFGHILDPVTRSAELARLIEGRYGSGTPRPGYSDTNDMLSRVKALRHPANYQLAPPAQPLTHYASPPDIWGFDVRGLNFTGHTLSVARGLPDPAFGLNGNTDEPYELNLSDTSIDDVGIIDGPYKLAELERLLRYPDLDSVALPTRLLSNSFTGFNRTAHARRNVVTTESRHIPSPNTQLAPEQRGLSYNSEAAANFGLQGPNIADLLQGKLSQASFAGNVNDQLELQLPFEVRHGEMFNLNRLFGDGADNVDLVSGAMNGIVDDPNETVQNLNPNNQNNALPGFEFIWKNLGLPADFDNARFNYLNNQVRVPSNRYVRQMYARHLYCLMMLLIDNGKNPSGTVPGTSYIRDAFREVGLNDNQQKELIARRVAQWAINVVDFRDPDAIMTPFEYDVDPLNADGWDPNIDGDPRTNEYDPSSVPRAPDRRIVWGCEYPDLLITEVKALHDRRVMDTDVENIGSPKKRTDSPMRDPHVDQYRLPQGSLFMEFYCPRNRLERSASEVYNKTPLELYTSNGTIPFLDLGRMAPAAMPNNAPNRGAHPVWRVAISASHLNNLSGLNTFMRTNSNPDSISFQPEDMSLLPPHLSSGANQVNLDRFVWFANVDPVAAGVRNPELVYWNRVASPLLRAGSYAVVGPRVTTHVGSKVQPTVDLAGGTRPQYLPSNQKIVLNNATAEGVRYFNRANNTANPDSPVLARSQKALSIIAAASFPPAWDNTDLATADLGLGVGNINQVGVGISVSEPLTNAYYAQPTKNIFGVANTPKDSWYDPPTLHLSDPDPTVANALPDRPFDERANSPLAQPGQELNRTHTRENYRTAFLQRLADPTIPWNPGWGEPGHNANYPVNPYITVDWSPIDLTVFSGEMRNGTFMAGGNTYWIDDADQDPLDPMGRREKFDTREKGNDKAGPTTPDKVNIWTQDVTTPQDTIVDPLGNEYFSVDLNNSFGFLNKTYGFARNGSVAGADYRGDPAIPWPWLTWNNRPFDSSFELMNVPATSMSRLLHEFQMPVAVGNPDPYNSLGTAPARRASFFLAPFNHLLNFFHTADPNQQFQSPHYYRIFNIVSTPSPFVGTEKWYNPAQFANMQPGPDAKWGVANQDDDGDGIIDNFSEACWQGSDDIGIPANTFRPPYNNLSRFRDPGRINVNTIFDQVVFEGLMKGFPAMDPSVNATVWNRMRTSRQGYGGAAGALNPNFPTRFAHPFRSAASGDIAPLQNLRQAGIDATLLRRDPQQPTRPLLDFDSSTQPNDQYNSSLRNPGFRYAGVQRLSNLLTTHSNVFAVWVTIGYFEVEPPNPALSVDHQLGAEIGSDTGEIKRHRAFYIIDRSIPVAYEPDENHNVDKCIRVRRFIE